MAKLNQLMITMLALLMVSTVSFAGELSTFHDVLDDAYAPYRKSLPLTKKKENQQAALKQMNAFMTKWATLSDKYLGNPPAPYNQSPLWKDTITRVAQIMQDGISKVEAGEIQKGHEIIEEIRDLLGSLRASVSIRTFSDYVNTYHTEMERLVKIKHNKKSLTPENIIKVREKVAVLSFLMNEAKLAAPAKYQQNEDFQKYLNGNIKLLAALHTSLEKGDVNKVLALLKKIKPAYKKLFVNFG